MSRFLSHVAGAGLMAAAGFGVGSVEGEISPKTQPRDLDVHESHASASLLGQFRTSVSAWLWVRTDLYLHNGVELRPMTEWELKQGRQASDAKDDGFAPLMDESTLTTVVPSAQHDFRGLFGDVERQISSFKEMSGHDHNDPAMALPLFRLMTWIDPQFIPGWTVGATVMSRDRTQNGTRKTLEYLQSGLKANPNSIPILVELGQTYITRAQDLRSAARALEEALSAFRALDEKAEFDEDDVRKAYRWLGLCYRDLWRRSELKALAREGLAVFPDDLVLQRLLNPPPSVLLPQNGEPDPVKPVLRA